MFFMYGLYLSISSLALNFLPFGRQIYHNFPDEKTIPPDFE